jgi:hypothetical protein
MKEMKFFAEWKKGQNEENQENKIIVTADKALEILKLISDEDCETLGKFVYKSI